MFSSFPNEVCLQMSPPATWLRSSLEIDICWYIWYHWPVRVFLNVSNFSSMANLSSNLSTTGSHVEINCRLHPVGGPNPSMWLWDIYYMLPLKQVPPVLHPFQLAIKFLTIFTFYNYRILTFLPVWLYNTFRCYVDSPS